MRTFTLILLAVTLLAVAPVRCGAQVYAVGTHRGPMVTLRVDEHTWLIGGWPNGYGLLQFRARTGEGAPWLRSTTICFGRPVLTVRLPAVLVAGIGLVAASSYILFAVAIGSRIRRVRRDETDVA